MTAEQLMHLPSRGKWYELRRGELLKMVPAGALHGDVAMALGTFMRVYASQEKLGKVLKVPFTNVPISVAKRLLPNRRVAERPARGK